PVTAYVTRRFGPGVSSRRWVTARLRHAPFGRAGPAQGTRSLPVLLVCMPRRSSSPAVCPRRLVLLAALYLALPRSGRGEDAVAYKFQSWQEDSGRIRVDAHYGLIE